MHDHTDATKPDGQPSRRATLLTNQYFVDRLLVTLCALLTTTAIGLLGWRTASFDHQFDRWIVTEYSHPPVDPAIMREWFRTETFPYDHSASIYGQYFELTVGYLTWEPIAITILACSGLAIVLQLRYDR